MLPVSAHATTPENRAIKERLRTELRSARSASDSLKLMYDIYDLSDTRDQRELAPRIYDVAERAGQTDDMMDMLRQQAVLNKDSEKVLKSLIEKVSERLDSETRKATQLFLEVELATYYANFLSEEERQERLTAMLAKEESNTGEKDQYERVKDLYMVAIYLGSSSKGGMYSSYVKRLGEEINKLPKEAFAIRNIFFANSAIYFYSNGVYDKSLEADRNLLKSIDALEAFYRKQGRKYRNYDLSRYKSYRRMLGNYKGLTLHEVDSIYHLAQTIALRNDDAREFMEKASRPKIYWLMAHKEYAQAIPLIKKFLTSGVEDSHNNNIRLQMLRNLKEAATATGDDETLLMALKEYDQRLEDYLRLNAEHTYRELQIRYDVNELKARNHHLDIQSRDLRLKSERQIILVAVVFACLLLGLLLLLHRRYADLKVKHRDLEEEFEKAGLSDKTLPERPEYFRNH